MKHIVLLSLFLFPVFLYAQYPTTGNKQRLGWQTTGDGLIWRGVAADTVYKPNNRNYPYFQLDTVNAVLYRYIATQGSWQAVGGGVDTSLFVRYTDRNYQISLTKGLISGGVVTINADPTKIDISAGTGILVDDWTDPQNPVTYDVSWNAFTALAVTYLGTSTFSNILITNTGAVLQTEDDPTDVQMRENIYLARLGHTDLTAVQSIVPKYSAAQSPMSQLNGLINFIGLINSGNVISANGANLSINKSAGQLHGKGVNYAVSTQTPNTVSIASATAPTIRRRTQTGVGTSSAFLDVGNYDVAGTITALSGTKYTNQRVFLFTNGNIVVQYGQVQYTTMTLAIAGVETEEFVIFPNLTDAALIGVISVRSTATDLSDPAQAYFGLVSKFGELGFGSGGAGTYNSWTAAADTGTPAVINDGETLTTAGGFGVNTSISGNTITVEADTAQVATQYDLSSYLPILGGRLTGTAGAGFIGFPTQSSVPATPANGFSIFGDNTGRFSWIQTDGYLRTLISPTAVADRGYRFQNKSYTLADSADVAALPTGSGTLNYIPKWTSASALGNSNMTDNNTVVSILNSKPFALGQWTTAGRPTGVSGYMGYNTTLTGIDWYNGTRWATGLESTAATFASTSVLFSDANGQTTANSTNFSWNNTKGTLSVIQIGTAQQDNAITARGTGSSAGVWKGRIVAGGANSVFLMGEINSQAWLGGHNGALDAWNDIYIQPDGAANLYLGNYKELFLSTRKPIIKIGNSTGALTAMLDTFRMVNSISQNVFRVLNTGLLTLTDYRVGAAQWRGSITNGGQSGSVVMGEFNSRASIGGHTSGGAAWADFFIQFDGTTKTRIGKSDILTIDNNNNRITYRGTAGSYDFDMSVSTNSFGVPRGTVVQRPTVASSTTPFRYNTDSTALEYGESVGTWRQLATREYARSLVSAIPTSNIYTANGSLTADRTLHGAGYTLRFNANTAVRDSLKVANLADHTDPDSIVTTKGGWLGKKKFLMPAANAYSIGNSGYFFDAALAGHQISGNNYYHLDYADTSGYWEKGTYTAAGKYNGVYGSHSTGSAELFSSSGTKSSVIRVNINSGFLMRNHKSSQVFVIDTVGTFRSYLYGTGVKEATDLSKTQSEYIAGLATDGTITDYRIQRDTFTADADFTISATLLSTCQELFVSAEVSSGHTDTVNVILPLPSSTYANKKVHVFADDDNSTWWVAAKTLLGNGLYLGNPSGTKPAATNYVAVSTSAGFSGFTYTFTCTRRSTGTYHWVLSIQN